MKTYEIFHRTYGDVCGDSWYGKETKFMPVGFVTDTETNVKALVEKLNVKNNSYWAKEEPEDEYDDDFCDEDYFGYRELETTTVDEIEKRFGL